MSPVGGVGINLAVQDAVAAANLLAGPLRSGGDLDLLLPRVQRRRRLPTAATQAVQRQVHDRLLAPRLAGAPGRVGAGTGTAGLPLFLRVLCRVPALTRLTGRMVAIGVRPEHVSTPAALGSVRS